MLTQLINKGWTKQKTMHLKLWNALNPKCGDLGSWNLTTLIIWSDKQVSEFSAS